MSHRGKLFFLFLQRLVSDWPLLCSLPLSDADRLHRSARRSALPVGVGGHRWGGLGRQILPRGPSSSVGQTRFLSCIYILPSLRLRGGFKPSSLTRLIVQTGSGSDGSIPLVMLLWAQTSHDAPGSSLLLFLFSCSHSLPINPPY